MRSLATRLGAFFALTFGGARLHHRLGCPIIITLLRRDVEWQDLRSSGTTTVTLDTIAILLDVIFVVFLVFALKLERFRLFLPSRAAREQRGQVVILVNDVRGQEQHVRTAVCSKIFCRKRHALLYVVSRVRWICQEDVVLGHAPLFDDFVKIFVAIDDVRESNQSQVPSRTSGAVVRVINHQVGGRFIQAPARRL